MVFADVGPDISVMLTTPPTAVAHKLVVRRVFETPDFLNERVSGALVAEKRLQRRHKAVHLGSRHSSEDGSVGPSKRHKTSLRV